MYTFKGLKSNKSVHLFLLVFIPDLPCTFLIYECILISKIRTEANLSEAVVVQIVESMGRAMKSNKKDPKLIRTERTARKELKMKYERTEWWVEYNFENGIAMNIKVFRNKAEAEAFAKEHNSEALETKTYRN